jgi:hypothetical protein
MMRGNVERLGALLQRQIVDRLEARMNVDQAVEDMAKWYAEVLG